MKRKRWKFLLLFLVFLTGDYLKRRDFFEAEKEITYRKYESLNTKVPQGFSVHGIDVSRHNGEIFWKKIAETTIDSHRLNFAFIKASEGMFFHDREFLDNWNSAREAGVIRGAYHFFRPRYSTTFQAWNFIFNARLSKGDLPPVLDLEVDEGYSTLALVDKVRKWLRIVEKHYGVQPIIYTNNEFYQRVIRGRFDAYPIWIAQYKGETPTIAASRNWQFWQYSDKGTLHGINAKVDLNVFNGNLSDLKKICLEK